MKNRTKYPTNVEDAGTFKMFLLADETEFVDIEGPFDFRPVPRSTEYPDEDSAPALPEGTHRFTGPLVVMTSDGTKTSDGKAHYGLCEISPEAEAEIAEMKRIHGRILTVAEMKRMEAVHALSRMITGPIGDALYRVAPTKTTAIALTANLMSLGVPFAEGKGPEREGSDLINELVKQRIGNATTDAERDEARAKAREIMQNLVDGLNTKIAKMDEVCINNGCEPYGYYEGDPDAEAQRERAYSFRSMLGLPVLQDAENN